MYSFATGTHGDYMPKISKRCADDDDDDDIPVIRPSGPDSLIWGSRIASTTVSGTS
jgi:hypothetical protein